MFECLWMCDFLYFYLKYVFAQNSRSVQGRICCRRKAGLKFFLSEKLPGKYKFYHMQTDTGNGDNEERFIYKTKKREAFKKKCEIFYALIWPHPLPQLNQNWDTFWKKSVFPQKFSKSEYRRKMTKYLDPPLYFT